MENAMPEQEDTVAGFLQGMYYAGKVPSSVERGRITDYLCAKHLVAGTRQEIEHRVSEAMLAMHKRFTSMDFYTAELQRRERERES